MTDSRLPERYLTDRRILRLTDAERNSYIMATLWSVSNRTDGRIERDDLQFVPTFNLGSIPALTRTGLWAEEAEGWIDTEFEKVQTSKDDLEVLDNARRADREKKARQRAHAKGNHSLCNSGECRETTGATPSFTPSPGDDPGDVSRGQHRRGQDRIGDVIESSPPGEKKVSRRAKAEAWTAANPGWAGERDREDREEEDREEERARLRAAVAPYVARAEEDNRVRLETKPLGQVTIWPVAEIPNSTPPKAVDQPVKKPSFPKCRLCGQQAAQLDRAGLCRKVTPDHMRARAAA